MSPDFMSLGFSSNLDKMINPECSLEELKLRLKL